MAFRLRLPWSFGGSDGPSGSQPRAAVQESGGGVIITSPDELDDYIRGGEGTASGERVTTQTSLRVGAVYACNRVIAGAVATMPLHLKRRIDDRTRKDESDSDLGRLLRRRPNKWQKPAQFKRMLQSQVNLRGNGYALKVKVGGRLVALVPLNPDQMTVEQRDDLSIRYSYARRNGTRAEFSQDQIFHLFGLTLNGFTGVTALTYARETIGESLAMARHGANTFRNGAQVGGVLSTEKTLGKTGRANIREGLDEFRSQGEHAGKSLILEDGLSYSQMALSAVDAQWIEGRKFTRTEIAMFFGVPPHMIGDTEKSTSWGTGIEQQSLGFVAYTLEDHLTMWEEAITADLNDDPEIYTRFNRSALVRGDLKTRTAAYAQQAQWGIRSPNEIRALEDENPREGGDVYYDPPNTVGGQDKEDTDDEPEKTA